MHHRTAAAFVLLSLMVASCVPFVSSTESTMQRYVYLEPGYQIYVDDYSLEAPAGNFTISFKMSSIYYLYSVRAYGPDNQSLSISGNWSSTDSHFDVTVLAGDLTSFRVITILHGTTVYASNYSTPINFFPSVNASLSATTTVCLPVGSELLAFNETGISSLTIDGKTFLSGSIQTTPGAFTYSNVTYNGKFDLVALQSFDRVFEVSASGIHVSEHFKFMNVGNVKVENVTFEVPAGATNLHAYDLIGDLPVTFGVSNYTVTLHARILTGELATFTLEYGLPSSSISISGNTISLSGNLLPEWCNLLVRQLNLSIIMPDGSSNAVAQGGTVNTSGGKLVASFSNVSLSPFFNDPYSLSFSYSPVSSISWGVILVVLLIVAAVAYLAYRIFRRPKAAPAAVPTPDPASARPPPPPQKPWKKQKHGK